MKKKKYNIIVKVLCIYRRNFEYCGYKNCMKTICGDQTGLIYIVFREIKYLKIGDIIKIYDTKITNIKGNKGLIALDIESL